MTRQRSLAGLCAAALLALAGCASSPPTHWYALTVDPAPDERGAAMERAAAGMLAPLAPAPSTAPVPPESAVWEVRPELGLPGALDRDRLLVARGAASVEPLPSERWIEPLRDSLPRVLIHDLSRLRGPGRTWAAPTPAGVAASWRLRVDLLSLQASADLRRVELQAQWWLIDLHQPAAAPLHGQLTLRVPVDALPAAGGSGEAGGPLDAVAAAHRRALWQLAQAIVSDTRAAVAPAAAASGSSR